MLDSTIFKRVIWAVDVFEKNRKMHRLAVQSLKELAATAGAVVDPVYVLDVDPSMIYKGDPIVTDLKNSATKALEKIIKESKLDEIPNHTSGQVLMNQSITIGFDHRTEILLEYIKSSQADAILVSTHGRSGFKRVILGSFAEGLLSHSPIPVLTVNPTVTKVHAFQQILFPTNLHAGSKSVFKRIVSLARGLKCHLILYHCTSHPIDPIVQSGIYLLSGSWVPLFPSSSFGIDKKISRIQTWTRWALSQGISTEYVIHTTTGSLSEEVVSFAKKRKIGLIAIEEDSGPISSALLGSIVRQVSRHAPCPVMVLRPPHNIPASRPKIPTEKTPKAA